jgi:NAD(P)H-flavin reductase/hemoglobin-like flavoprotein
VANAEESGAAQSAAARLLEAVAADPVAFVRSFHVELFRTAPELALQFPSGLGGHRTAFVTIIEHILQAFAEGTDPPALIDLLGQLGRDHRKYRLSKQNYRVAQAALAKALSEAARSTRDGEFCAQAAALVCKVMEQESERGDGPEIWEAQVVERIDHPGPTVVVRLRAAMRPQPFAVGQYLAVQVPQCPGQWRYFSPALPPNVDGELEFHIRAAPGGIVSGAVLKNTLPGDRWLFGESYGSLGAGVDTIPPGQAVLMVAGDTGVAPLRALALALALRGENPRTTLLAGAHTRAECYDLPNLRDLARCNEWFNVLPVIDPEPWSTLARTAVEFGKRSEIILLSGSPTMIGTCLDALRGGGVPSGKIRQDPIW